MAYSIKMSSVDLEIMLKGLGRMTGVNNTVGVRIGLALR